LIKTKNDIKQILILGHPDLNGAFGDYLRTKLHGKGMSDIYSISVSVAGTRDFTMTVKISDAVTKSEKPVQENH
jgi:hypothetical protein